MRGFLRSNTFKILLIVVTITSSIMALSASTGDISFASLFGIITNPMNESVLQISEEYEIRYSSMSREELERHCAEVEYDNANLRNDLISYYDLKQENELYRQTLEIKEQKPELSLLPSLVVSRDSSNAFANFTIDVGSNSGVEVGDCVISVSGLVGVVTEVSMVSSFVTTIYSEDVNFGASSKEFKENGVVTGNAEFALNNLVKLQYLDKNTKIKKGTIITTSGNSGNYPPDIIIGEVAYLASEEQNSSLYAVVEPYFDVNTLSEVFVVTDFTEKDSTIVEDNTSTEQDKNDEE